MVDIVALAKERRLTEIKLDIGAGEFKKDDSYLGVDVQDGADIQAYMWDIPVPDASVDSIYSSNALEHVSKFQVVPTLREFYRILKPEGHLRLIVPDMVWALHWWLEHQDTGWSMDILFGTQEHDGQYHRTAFTPSIMHDYFKQSGCSWFISEINFIGGEVKQYVDTDGNLVEKVQQREIGIDAFKKEKENL